ncbi:MAG: hypothetical protein ACI8W8_002864, partial [Rhodothermales bacterium]
MKGIGLVRDFSFTIPVAYTFGRNRMSVFLNWDNLNSLSSISYVR